jgi:hypothetical protein
MANTSQLADLGFVEFESSDPPQNGTSPRRWTGRSSSISDMGADPKRPRCGTTKDTCDWCGQPLGPKNQSGRTRIYCGQSCRQRAYQSRKRSRQLSLRDGELVVSTVIVTRLNKRLRALDLALSEVEKANLEGTDQRIVELCLAARRLGRQVIGPPAR